MRNELSIDLSKVQFAYPDVMSVRGLSSQECANMIYQALKIEPDFGEIAPETQERLAVTRTKMAAMYGRQREGMERSGHIWVVKGDNESKLGALATKIGGTMETALFNYDGEGNLITDTNFREFMWKIEGAYTLAYFLSELGTKSVDEIFVNRILAEPWAKEMRIELYCQDSVKSAFNNAFGSNTETIWGQEAYDFVHILIDTLPGMAGIVEEMQKDMTLPAKDRLFTHESWPGCNDFYMKGMMLQRYPEVWWPGYDHDKDNESFKKVINNLNSIINLSQEVTGLWRK